MVQGAHLVEVQFAALIEYFQPLGGTAAAVVEALGLGAGAGEVRQCRGRGGLLVVCVEVGLSSTSLITAQLLDTAVTDQLKLADLISFLFRALPLLVPPVLIHNRRVYLIVCRNYSPIDPLSSSLMGIKPI